jgi:hypothetical protein
LTGSSLRVGLVYGERHLHPIEIIVIAVVVCLKQLIEFFGELLLRQEQAVGEQDPPLEGHLAVLYQSKRRYYCTLDCVINRRMNPVAQRRLPTYEHRTGTRAMYAKAIKSKHSHQWLGTQDDTMTRALVELVTRRQEDGSEAG